MTYDQEKSGLAITFVKYFTSAVSLMFLTKSLIWNKITFQLSNSLNPAELLVNELTRVYPENLLIFLFPFDLSMLIIKISGAYN